MEDDTSQAGENKVLCGGDGGAEMGYKQTSLFVAQGSSSQGSDAHDPEKKAY